ncbi:hypothetical protein ADUPG1_014215 [Aduncisulcus paluster]|uniref:Uncharacterized protein n=1 Tax=Aduncisulcus paluster TaxID=2918883 RepID=A0ABQ5KFZ0_9EUKA|nr:hypothetical protein ADUPG1_014215 [Aduncisulcus paluster]
MNPDESSSPHQKRQSDSSPQLSWAEREQLRMQEEYPSLPSRKKHQFWSEESQQLAQLQDSPWDSLEKKSKKGKKGRGGGKKKLVMFNNVLDTWTESQTERKKTKAEKSQPPGGKTWSSEPKEGKKVTSFSEKEFPTLKKREKTTSSPSSSVLKPKAKKQPSQGSNLVKRIEKQEKSTLVLAKKGDGKKPQSQPVKGSETQQAKKKVGKKDKKPLAKKEKKKILTLDDVIEKNEKAKQTKTKVKKGKETTLESEEDSTSKTKQQSSTSRFAILEPRTRDEKLETKKSKTQKSSEFPSLPSKKLSTDKKPVESKESAWGTQVPVSSSTSSKKKELKLSDIWNINILRGRRRQVKEDKPPGL